MRSLNVKLVVAFLVVSLTGTLLAGAYIWWMTTLEFRQYVVTQNLDTIVSRLGSEYSADGGWSNVTSWTAIDPFRSRPEPQKPPQSVPMPNDNSLAVADSSHHIVLAGRGYDVGEVVSDADYDSGIAIVVNDQEVGRLLINDASRSDQPFDRFMMRFYRALGIGSLGATLVALLLGAALARSLTSPLRKLTRATQAMSRGDLEQQVQIRSKDEMGELAQSFNRMSSDLVEAQNLRRQMTADIAHELRSPLSLILGYAEAWPMACSPPTRKPSASSMTKPSSFHAWWTICGPCRYPMPASFRCTVFRYRPANCSNRRRRPIAPRPRPMRST
jgi:signal transduction histidine kinase